VDVLQINNLNVLISAPTVTSRVEYSKQSIFYFVFTKLIKLLKVMRKLFIYKKCIGYADVGTSGTKKRPSKQKKEETFQEWKLIPMSQKDE
jgi:hypothetical protein